MRVKITDKDYVLIDDEDLHLISGIKWYVSSEGYACNKSKKIVYMHRLIMNASKGQFVDHKNCNRLDNRRENLRIATKKQNQAYKPSAHKNKTSQYKGVYKSNTGKWTAQCVVNNKNKNLGIFKTEKDAAEAYNKAALAEWGEFAWLNKLD